VLRQVRRSKARPVVRIAARLLLTVHRVPSTKCEDWCIARVAFGVPLHCEISCVKRI